MSPRYGYIGLGMMGSAMAGYLISTGADVTVYDINPAAIDQAVHHGGRAAATPREVAADSDVVSICVPAAEHIAAVLHGPDGLLAGAQPGLQVLIHSTVSPASMLEAHAACAAHGVELFDVCVYGGDKRARNGTQILLVGGRTEMHPAALALLDTYAETIIDAGPVGAGAALKLAVNVMTYAQFTAAAIGHDLVASAGGDASQVFTALAAAGMLGQLTDGYRHLLALDTQLLPPAMQATMRTQVGIAEKDLSLALELGGLRAGGAEVLSALHDGMAAVYGVDKGAK